METKAAYRLALLALAIYREAEGEPYEGKLAVGFTIFNRANEALKGRYGNGVDGVILKPSQYSSFNRDNPLASVVPALGDGALLESLRAAAAIFDLTAQDPTNGATHYHVFTGPGAVHPAWADKLKHTVDIGHHRFYRES